MTESVHRHADKLPRWWFLLQQVTPGHLALMTHTDAQGENNPTHLLQQLLICQTIQWKLESLILRRSRFIAGMSYYTVFIVSGVPNKLASFVSFIVSCTSLYSPLSGAITPHQRQSPTNQCSINISQNNNVQYLGNREIWNIHAVNIETIVIHLVEILHRCQHLFSRFLIQFSPELVYSDGSVCPPLITSPRPGNWWNSWGLRQESNASR